VKAPIEPPRARFFSNNKIDPGLSPDGPYSVFVIDKSNIFGRERREGVGGDNEKPNQVLNFIIEKVQAEL